MADLHVVLSSVSARATTGSTVTVLNSRSDESSEVLTETLSGTATSGIEAPEGVETIWMVTAQTAAKWVAFGPTPDPTQDPRWLILPTMTMGMRAYPGDKIGTMDA